MGGKLYQLFQRSILFSFVRRRNLVSTRFSTTNKQNHVEVRDYWQIEHDTVSSKCIFTDLKDFANSVTIPPVKTLKTPDMSSIHLTMKAPLLVKNVHL